MFSRGLRAETRSKTKEDLKRVNKSNGHVRNWEKKWVAVKDTSMLVYKWIPSLAVDAAHLKRTSFNRQASATHNTHNTGGLLASFGRSKPVSETTVCNDTRNGTDTTDEQASQTAVQTSKSTEPPAEDDKSGNTESVSLDEPPHDEVLQLEPSEATGDSSEIPPVLTLSGEMVAEVATEQ
ncbi:B-cell CLL/lymphoma 7 protein member A [Clonorchis sinensis]|uniref:B-cell CLL/lymphoma 7 protein member A n=1 Tax=Clonorchis sinensis TaxID=79923 RepID=A0A8T1MA43_CLOSI|nr:B-cell CLL/lymphoma 7 protein member A [Clonorchis sinensis]